MTAPASGWLVYRIIEGKKAQVIGIYDQYEKASDHVELLGRALSEGWMIVGAPFVGWEHGTSTSHRTETPISTPAPEQGAGDVRYVCWCDKQHSSLEEYRACLDSRYARSPIPKLVHS